MCTSSCRSIWERFCRLMNMVVPVCECPKCARLGLHFMAETFAEETMVPHMQLSEVPRMASFVDGTEKEVYELKCRQVIAIRRFTFVVRECWFCHHKFDQTWKEESIE